MKRNFQNWVTGRAPRVSQLSAGGIAVLLLVSGCQAELGERAGKGKGGDGSTLPPLDEPDEIVLGGEGDANLIDHDSLFQCEEPDKTASPPRLWRLTGYQLKNLYGKIADTLQNGSGHEIAGYVDPFGAPSTQTRFPNYASSFGLDELEFETVLENGRNLKFQILEKGANRGDWNCIAEKPWTEECVRQVARNSAEKLLRRAPSEAEIDAYYSLYADIEKTSGDELALESMLQAIGASPEVLFRFELGGEQEDAQGRSRLTSAEIADALSFTLTNRPPGDDLQQAVANGVLDTKEGVEAEARRLLEDLSDNSAAVQFLRQYYHYDDADRAFKDPHPEVPDYNYRGDDLVGHTDAFMKDALGQQTGFFEFLMTSDRAYTNERSAATLNLQSAEEGPLDLPERSGIITQPSWLSWYAHADHTDPIRRGKFVYVDMLCNSIPDIPLDVVAQLPEDDSMTGRDKLTQHSEEARCWSCHQFMDPIGLGIEELDHIGRFRDAEAGKPVDTSGELVGSDVDGPFNGAEELSEKLAGSRRAAECFVRHAFRFYMGRNERLVDSCSMLDAANGFFDNEQDYKEMLVSLVTSDAFLYRKAEETSGD